MKETAGSAPEAEGRQESPDPGGCGREEVGTQATPGRAVSSMLRMLSVTFQRLSQQRN